MVFKSYACLAIFFSEIINFITTLILEGKINIINLTINAYLKFHRN